MNRIIKIEKDLTTQAEVLALAKRSITVEGKRLLDKKKKHYIFIEGPETSDLVVLKMNEIETAFKFRKCTSEEWDEYYYNNIAKKNEI